MPPEDQMTCWPPDDMPTLDIPVATAIRRLGHLLVGIGFVIVAGFALWYAQINGAF